MVPEQGSVMASIREEEDNTADAAVHLLALDASLEGLKIARACFRLDANRQSGSDENGIPRP